MLCESLQVLTGKNDQFFHPPSAKNRTIVTGFTDRHVTQPATIVCLKTCCCFFKQVPINKFVLKYPIWGSVLSSKPLLFLHHLSVWPPFLSVPRYDCCVPSSHPSFCILVKHGPSQQSSKKEYKPWKWGATARYYVSPTKTMLPKKSVPRSSRQSDHTKTSWPWYRDADCSGMVMSPVHQV